MRRRMAEPTPHEATARTRRRRIIVLAGLVLVLVFLPLVALTIRVLTPMPAPPQNLPIRNGYDDLLAAAERTAGAQISSFRVGTATPEELRASIKRVGIDIPSVRRAVRSDASVPIDYVNGTHPLWDEEQGVLSSFGGFGSLAEILVEDAYLRALSDDIDSAWDAYLDAFRLAELLGRDGIDVDEEESTYVEAMASAGIQDSLPLLAERTNPQTYRHVIGVLLAYDAKRNSLEQIADRAWIWAYNSKLPSERLQWLLLEWDSEYTHRSQLDLDYIDDLRWMVQSATRHLICELGVHCYVAEQGRLPDLLDGLVPDILPSIPVDPRTDMPFTYERRSDTRYQVGDPDYWSATRIDLPL